MQRTSAASSAFRLALIDDFESQTRQRRIFVSLGAPIVVKADGLAAGKGVVVAKTLEEAEVAVDALLSAALVSAGAAIVVEEFLEGEEVSFFALCDGVTAMPFASAQDHKRVGDGDTGPNTGGMGALFSTSLNDCGIDRTRHARSGGANIARNERKRIALSRRAICWA